MIKKINYFFKGKKERKNLNEIHDYWKNPNDDKNNPEVYARQEATERSAFLYKITQQCNISTKSKIIELGCNVGRNLNYLSQKGFTNIYGIEISENALEKMKEIYPKMSSSIEVFHSAIEDKISQFEKDEFDLVFTMAVLEHVHTDSEWIFEEIVRITKRYLITVEDEKGTSWRHFPRNYRKIFEKLGLEEILEMKCDEVPDLPKSFRARVFEKK
ncbi:MAG: class I SAM-dependent methyltransferase [Nitrosopumilus sp.]|nr:class I SAM-dependent methyltransferase [Nitrosopumilus sp.]